MTVLYTLKARKSVTQWVMQLCTFWLCEKRLRGENSCTTKSTLWGGAGAPCSFPQCLIFFFPSMNRFKRCGWICWWQGELASAAVSIIAVFTFSLIKGGFFGKLQGARTARCDIHWCVCWQLAVLLHFEILYVILKLNCTCSWTEHFWHVNTTSFMFVCTSKGQNFVPKRKYFCKYNHQCRLF